MSGKKIAVSSAGSNLTPLEGEQLATFAHYVKGDQFRFLVLRMPDGEISLTHRDSLKRVRTLPLLTLSHDYVAAGHRAIDALIEKVGADRVHLVLSAG